MAENPIRYSDLIEADDSIQKAIKELTDLKAIYEEMVKTIQSHATEVKNSMKSTSGATEEGRKATKKASSETKQLERAYKQLSFAMSETGAKLAQVRAAIAQTNADSRAQIQMIRASDESYTAYKSRLELAVATYKKLSKEEALNTAEGQQLLNTILQLKTQIREYDQAMKLSVKTQKEATSAAKQERTELSALEQAKLKLAAARSKENMELLKTQRETKVAIQLAKIEERLANSAIGSYDHLSAQYEKNKITLNGLSREYRETNKHGMALEQQTYDIYQQMIRLQEATGKHTLSVGNYRKAWNGLNAGVSQLVRELPALGISMNTFFLAVSNNIPILADEIKSLRLINKELVQTGKAPINIWKQLGSAIFGFNTLLMLVVTAFSMFGEEIINYVTGLFKAKSATDSLTLSQKALAFVVSEGAGELKSSVEGVIELGIAIRKYGGDAKYTEGLIKKFNETFGTHYETIEEVRKAYPKLAKAQIDAAVRMAASQRLISDAASQLIRGQKADQMLSAFSPEQVAQARKSFDDLFRLYDEMLVKEGVKREDIITKKNELFSEIAKGDFVTEKGFASLFPSKFSKLYADAMQKNWNLAAVMRKFSSESGQQLLTGVVNQVASAGARQSLTDAAEKLYEGSLSDIFDDPKEPKDPKAAADRAEEIMRANNEIAAKYAESQTALLREEYAKRGQALTDSFNAEKQELLNKQANDKDLTEASKALINDTIANMQKQLDYELGELDKDRQAAELQVQSDTISLRIEATEQGTEDEHELRMQLLETQRQQELDANARLVENLRQSEDDINAKWNQKALDERQAFNEAFYLGQFEQQQKTAEAEFNSVKRSEYEKQKFRLDQDKAYWQLRLKMAEEGAIQATDLEIEGMKAFKKAIEFETSDLKDKQFDIYSLIGLNLKDEEKEAIKQATDFAIGQMRALFAAEKEIADQAVELANKRAEAAQRAVDSEIQARENGYAYNLSAANRELDAARKQQKEALKLQEEAVKRQQALDTMEQVSSLVTASANIWKLTSKINPLLAIGLIALMFGTFTAAKIKASQATKASSNAKLYAEGGVEFLDGGSHASGNDIPLGHTKDGRQRRAEGGEALAIIRKSQAGKYRRVLPDIIGSLNKGTFERKYMAALVGNAVVNVTANSVDTQRMETELRTIREQGERRFAVSPDGRMVEIYKNLKTVYK